MEVEFVSRGDIRAERGLLLIGDQAIRFRQQSKSRHQFLDLGAEWKKATGKPFVYALWLVRPDCDGKLAVAEALRSLGQNNIENLRALITAQPESIREFCEFYFRECLRFAFDEEEKRGFQRFGELCVKQKLLPARSAHSETDLNGDLCIGVCSWTCDRDVFFCFDNDMKVHAPFDLQQLAGCPA